MASVPQELAAFCDREYPRLVGTLTLYCGDREVARDLAQEAMIKLVGSWKRVSRYERPGGWLHRVGLNLANSYFRRKRAEWRANGRVGGRRSQHAVEDDRADTRMAMRRAVAGLPRRQREVLVLRYFADLTTAEVADQLGITRGSVRVLTHRAVSSLRDEFGDLLPSEEETAHV